MVVLNLIPVISGGGLQNALSFVRSSNLNGVVVLAREVPELREAIQKSGGTFKGVKPGRFRRIVAELVYGFAFPRRTKVLTLFGPPLLAPKRYIDLVGCAYSNLLYPELDFWGRQKFLRKCLSHLKDRYRMWALGRADGWIFETEVLRGRAVDKFSFPARRAVVIRMTPGWWIKDAGQNLTPVDQLLGDDFRVLYLTGYHVNKRIEVLTDVALQLKRRGWSSIKFVVSINSGTGAGRAIKDAADVLGVGDMFEFIGSVPVKEAPGVIATCHAMCNLAVLESFSNNVVEAWACRRPLLITDADWARSACGAGAVYVDPNDAGCVAESLVRLASDSSFRSNLIYEGSQQLERYPTIEDRTSQYWAELGSIAPRSSMGRSVWAVRSGARAPSCTE